MTQFSSSEDMKNVCKWIKENRISGGVDNLYDNFDDAWDKTEMPRRLTEFLDEVLNH